MVRLGDGVEAKSLCVKPFDKRLVNVDHELLAGDILRAAGLRVPAARLVSQAEIDDEITPNLIAKFECTSGSWSMPDFLQNAGLYWSRADLRQKAGIPESLAVAQQEAFKVKRAERRAAIEAGEARAEPVAVLEYVRGPTLLQSGSITALGASGLSWVRLHAAGHEDAAAVRRQERQQRRRQRLLLCQHSGGCCTVALRQAKRPA